MEEEESIANITGVTFVEFEPWDLIARDIRYDIVFLTFCTIGLFADFAVAHTILRYKRMLTPQNIILANWAIADFCVLLMCPSGYRIIAVVRHLDLAHSFMCLTSEPGALFHILVMVFVTFMSVDWFFKAHVEKASAAMRSKYKLVLICMWVGCCLCLLYFVGRCLYATFSHNAVFLLLSGFIVVLNWLICQISRLVSKCRKKVVTHSTFMLNLVGMYLLTNVLSLTVLLLDVTTLGKFKWLETIGVSLMFASGAVNFFALYIFDQNFKACFKLSLKFKRVPYSESIAELETRNNTSSGEPTSTQA